jgi:hypothetical protein
MVHLQNINKQNIMQRHTNAMAVITIIKTLPPLERKVVYEWLNTNNTLIEPSKQEDLNDNFWHEISLKSLNEAWENEEEDIWDEVYKQQKENGQLQSV